MQFNDDFHPVVEPFVLESAFTGRSLSSPRGVAELCLAFEVRRRLM